jgi:putative transcriptional regulator
VKVSWRLRMAAAQREVWTGAQLRRLLAERAGLHLSSASVSALLTRQPAQVKLETLAALCTALECTPNDLIEVDTTPVAEGAAKPAAGCSVGRDCEGAQINGVRALGQQGYGRDIEAPRVQSASKATAGTGGGSPWPRATGQYAQFATEPASYDAVRARSENLKGGDAE